MVSQVYLKAIWHNDKLIMCLTGVVILMMNVVE